MKVDLTKASSEERRLILVASDEKYQSLTSAIDWDWAKLGLISGATLVAVFTGFGPIVQFIHAGAMAAWWRNRVKDKKEIHGFRRQKQLPIPHLTPEEAQRLFQFDSDHPVDGTMYVLHPYNKERYLLPAVANEQLAHEKYDAFLDIAVNLGAKKIELLSGSVTAKQGHGSANVGLAEIGAKIGLKVGVERGNVISHQVQATYANSSRPPSVPKSHQVWIDADRDLRTLLRNRLEHNALTWKSQLVFGEIIHLNAEICTQLATWGVNIGGEYRVWQSSQWEFAIEFWPKVDQDSL